MLIPHNLLTLTQTACPLVRGLNGWLFLSMCQDVIDQEQFVNTVKLTEICLISHTIADSKCLLFSIQRTLNSYFGSFLMIKAFGNHFKMNLQSLVWSAASLISIKYANWNSLNMDPIIMLLFLTSLPSTITDHCQYSSSKNMTNKEPQIGCSLLRTSGGDLLWNIVFQCFKIKRLFSIFPSVSKVRSLYSTF